MSRKGGRAVVGSVDAGAERRTGYDAIIIGAGVIGAAIALSLSRRGWRTLNVDRNGQPGHGSTSASAGIIRVHAASRDAVILAQEALPYWHQWGDYLKAEPDEPLAEFRSCGSVILRDGTDYPDQVVCTLSSLGIYFEEWDTDGLLERLPFFDVSAFGPPCLPQEDAFWHDPVDVLPGAVYTPSSGYVSDPALAAQNLFHSAVRAGASHLPRVTVVEIRQRGGRTIGVTLSDGRRLDAPVVVNAAGPHSDHINRLAGVEDGMRVRTRPLRQELHHVPAPPGVDYELSGLHIVDGDLGINFRPEVGNALLVGGNGAACDGEVRVDDADRHDDHVTAEVWDRHVLRLARRVPSLPVPSRPSGVAGLYDVTEDWLPIYDHTDLSGFYVAIGTSGNQFKTAPLVGELMSELIETTQAGRDIDAEPLVVHGRHSGWEIEMDTYSRRREPQPNGLRG
jgi:sarcosine oxidase subunit beta